MDKRYIVLASHVYHRDAIHAYDGNKIWPKLELQELHTYKTYNIFDIKKIINTDKEHGDDKWIYTTIEASAIQTI